MSVSPAKNQISLGIRSVWSESSLSAWKKLGSLATHLAHFEDWVDAQADLSLRWAHITLLVCHVAAQIDDYDSRSLIERNIIQNNFSTW